jgi:hypothetical protein
LTETSISFRSFPEFLRSLMLSIDDTTVTSMSHLRLLN